MYKLKPKKILMRTNGGVKNATTSEYVRLKKAWKKWNSKCHPEDKITWVEYLDEFSKY